jgi:hypothetical protein
MREKTTTGTDCDWESIRQVKTHGIARTKKDMVDTPSRPADSFSRQASYINAHLTELAAQDARCFHPVDNCNCASYNDFKTFLGYTKGTDTCPSGRVAVAQEVPGSSDINVTADISYRVLRDSIRTRTGRVAVSLK